MHDRLRAGKPLQYITDRQANSAPTLSGMEVPTKVLRRSAAVK